MNQWWMTRCAALALCLAGCAALSDDMQRAQSAFEAARYEEVETWLAALEPDLADMDRGLRTRFYYLRGTTAFRLSKPGAARHYLVLAREELRHDPDALRPAWRDELVRMLTELGVPKALREFTVRNGLSGAGGTSARCETPAQLTAQAISDRELGRRWVGGSGAGCRKARRTWARPVGEGFELGEGAICHRGG